MKKDITVESLAIEAAYADMAECDAPCTAQVLRDMAIDAYRALLSTVHAGVVEDARDEFVAAYAEARS